MCVQRNRNDSVVKRAENLVFYFLFEVGDKIPVLRWRETEVR